MMKRRQGGYWKEAKTKQTGSDMVNVNISRKGVIHLPSSEVTKESLLVFGKFGQ